MATSAQLIAAPAQARRGFRLTSRGAFVASDGGRKRIFLPATIAVARIGVFKGDEQVGKGFRTEIASWAPHAGVERLPNDEERPHGVWCVEPVARRT